MTDPKKLGASIKATRQRSRLTQQALADRAGTNKQSISYWERGDHWPSVENIIRLANALGVSADSLLGIDRAYFGYCNHCAAPAALDDHGCCPICATAYQAGAAAEREAILSELRQIRAEEENSFGRHTFAGPVAAAGVGRCIDLISARGETDRRRDP